ncbi:MAG: HD domain-containing protein [Fimbriimonadaceae bacterium]|nr:HD domain-containing protein [Fimbriimonadaceae bacterium]
MLAQPHDAKARILIIDDDEDNHLLIRRALKQNPNLLIESVTDSRLALATSIAFCPDIILLDLHMMPYDGYEVMEQILGDLPDSVYLPILVLTGDDSNEAKRRALTAGAKDFVSKYASLDEIYLRTRNLLHTRLLYQELERRKAGLEERVRERTAELEQAQREILQRLALAAEYRDDDTGAHTRRVGNLAALIALAMGLPKDRAEVLRTAAPLHDLGKIGIPDGILLKPGALTPAERESMRRHAVVGANILSGSSAELLRCAEEIARTHHERWDGLGYPDGLSGDRIPLVGRIVAVADVFDALTHPRPYKSAWEIPDAVREIQDKSGTQFDPAAVNAFLTVVERLDLSVSDDLDGALAAAFRPNGCAEASWESASWSEAAVL